VKEYQIKLPDWLSTRKEVLLNSIRDKKALDDDLEAQLRSALDEFKSVWK
jgi:F0F1-type ATP synthase alpha subunit